MKKIVIYIASMKASGGIERVVANLVNQWVRTYDVTLCTKDGEESFYALPDAVHRVPLHCDLTMDMNSRLNRVKSVFLNFFQSRKKLRKALAGIDPDIIYTTTPMDALEVYSAGKQYRQRLVASEHGSIAGYNGVYTRIKRFLYPRIKCVSVPNRMDTEAYRQWGANAVYIPHIVSFGDTEKSLLQNKIVLNIGRMTADKQQSRLIHIWNAVPKKEGWQLWIVGDGEEKSRLQGLISQLNLEPSVRLLPPTKEIQAIYRQASVFALASRFEGFGMVLLEAMSFGVPCISFDCPSGPRDVVKDGCNGFLIENGNDAAYAEKLQEMLLMAPAELGRFGDGAFETVRNWDNEGILAQWDAVFQ